MNPHISEYRETSLTTARLLRAFLVLVWGSFFSFQLYQEGQRILTPEVTALGALDPSTSPM